MACLENWNLNYAKRSCSIQFKITTIKKKASSMFNRHGSFSVLVRGCLIILASHFQQHILEQFMFSLVLVFAEYFFSFSSICAPSLFVRTGSAYLTCNSHSTKDRKPYWIHRFDSGDTTVNPRSRTRNVSPLLGGPRQSCPSHTSLFRFR